MQEEFLLITPENVPISYELAGVGSRFVAALLDALIVCATLVGLAAVTYLPALIAGAPQDAYPWLTAAFLLLSFALLFGYPIFFEIAWSGQTPGKRRTGIRIVRNDGGPITALAVVIRNVIRLADFLPAYYIIGAVTMLIDRRSRRLGDLAASTICIKERRDVTSDRLSPRAAAYGRKKTWPNDPPLDNLGRLSAEDRHLVKEYLLRRDRLASGASQSLAARIAERIAPKIEMELRGQTPDEFLERVGLEMEQQAKGE